MQRLRYGRRWAVGAWFVPILNLFRPKQVREGAAALELACTETGSEAASLTLTANGAELVHVRDPLLYMTGVGLFVASTSGDAGAAFDDLLVEVLD